jgi:fructosamine-3-kinase
VVRIVLELNPSGWRCVGLVVANTHKAKERAPGGLVVNNTSGETSVGVLQARGSH